METRFLTQFEIGLLSMKCRGAWSYSDKVVYGLIALGNGDGDTVTAYLPYGILMNEHVWKIGVEHTLTPSKAKSLTPQNRIEL